MCPPGQGMSGRVYQIDAGWMGGAASIGYRQLSFLACRGRGYWSRQTLVLRAGQRVQCFLKMLTPCRAWRIFLRNSKRLAAKELCPRRLGASAAGHLHTTSKCAEEEIHHGDIQQ